MYLILSCAITSFGPVAVIAPKINKVPGFTPPIVVPAGKRSVLFVISDSIGTPPIYIVSFEICKLPAHIVENGNSDVPKSIP